MVLTLGIPMRLYYGLEDFITVKHLDNCAKLLLVTGMIVVYGYGFEAFTSWYSDNQYEKYIAIDRGARRVSLSLLHAHFLQCLLHPTSLVQEGAAIRLDALHSRVRREYRNVDGTLHYHPGQPAPRFLPSSWGMYHGNGWDWATFIGTMGQFFFLFLLFLRALPSISITEIRELVAKRNS